MNKMLLFFGLIYLGINSCTSESKLENASNVDCEKVIKELQGVNDMLEKENTALMNRVGELETALANRK